MLLTYQATDKALKLQSRGDFKGAVKQWNIVVDTFESGDDGVVVSAQVGLGFRV